jgi:sporulation protein YlmC with PRC-barrel domain
MLKNIKEMYGGRLAALDGDIGHVKDFYFDDKSWVIRYLVADTAQWLTGRLVLVSPHAFGRFNQRGKVLHLGLTRSQIEKSPSIESHKPVSRQYEIDYYRYYGWPAYWNGGALWGMGAYPLASTPSKDEMADRLEPHPRDDKHLRSTHEINGYEIQTTDGTIGQVSGLMVDDQSWRIHELVVEAGHWYSGKEVLIAPSKIERISYEESKVFVSLTKEDIRQTAANQLAGAGKSAVATFQD